MDPKLLLVLLPTLLFFVACGPDPDDDDASDDDDATDPIEFALWSPDFVDDEGIDHSFDCEQALPPEFSCGNSNPEIRWEGAPEGTVAFALIFDDVSFGEYAHWAIYNISGDEDGLDAGISGYAVGNDPPGDAEELTNGSGFEGYLGSCPQFVNHYRWRLWALDSELDVDSSASYGDLEDAAEDAELDSVEMCHVFDGANADLRR